MLLTEIDHVAIAVNDLEAAIEYYRETFGCEVAHREVVERDGVEEALLKVADSYVQLLTPVRDDSTVAKFLEKNGEGIHHVGYRVDDCAAAVDRVRAEGGRLIDEVPRLYAQRRPENVREKGNDEVVRTNFAAHLYSYPFAKLARHPRLVEPAKQLFGEDTKVNLLASDPPGQMAKLRLAVNEKNEQWHARVWSLF